MSKRLIIHLAVAFLVFFAWPIVSLCQSNTSGSDTEKLKAEQAWEAVVKAKGGRERLQAVQNVIIESGKPATAIWLFAFPDKYWRWTSEGPGPVPWSSMIFYNGEPHTYYWITQDKTIRDTADPQRAMNRETALYLLETSWLKPEIVSVQRVRDGDHLLDVIETRVNGERLDFAVEVEQMLVLKVMWYGRKVTRKKPLNTYLFSDYGPENGIQMPHGEQMVDDGDKMRKRTLYYRFNVEYDKDFFKRPPPLSAGPDAWKPKRQVP